MIAKKIGVGLMTAGLLTLTMASSVLAADSTVGITGNGVSSVNSVTVNNNCLSTVNQSSKTTVGVEADVNANTGSNVVSSNTGGTVSITTGAATSSVGVVVMGGDNSATPPSCCGCSTDPLVTVSGNGDKSTNVVVVGGTQTTSVTQKSKTKTWVGADVKAVSGKNKIKNNTGSGVTLGTGAAASSVGVTVLGGNNSTP